MKSYVLGFMFDLKCESVVLVRKKSPAWQTGKWNGVGGKIEDGEIPFLAMSRECMEETGYKKGSLGWDAVAIFTCLGGTVYAYKTQFLDFDWLPAANDNQEELRVFPVDKLPADVIPNLRWLIPMQLDRIELPVLFRYEDCECC